MGGKRGSIEVWMGRSSNLELCWKLSPTVMLRHRFSAASVSVSSPSVCECASAVRMVVCFPLRALLCFHSFSVRCVLLTVRGGVNLARDDVSRRKQQCAYMCLRVLKCQRAQFCFALLTQPPLQGFVVHTCIACEYVDTI